MRAVTGVAVRFSQSFGEGRSNPQACCLPFFFASTIEMTSDLYLNRWGKMIRRSFAPAAFVAAALLFGCGLQQPSSVTTQPAGTPSSGIATAPASQTATATTTGTAQTPAIHGAGAPPVAQMTGVPAFQASVARARPLPFKGRLVDGDPEELPPVVAMSLSNTSAVTFSYREELTHDEYHIPLIVSALDPVTYFGAPLGDFGVTAFASLSIVDGDRILGDYTAKAYVSKSYTLYSEPSHAELERAARAAVRERIDQKLYRDANRLEQAAAGSGRPTAAPIGK
jgi:hypothetical protein